MRSGRWSGRVWLRAHPLAADALLALVGLVGFWAAYGSTYLTEVVRGRPVLLIALTVLGAVPIVVRRRAPWAAVALVCVALAAGRLAGVASSLTEALSLLIVAYSVAAVLPSRQAVAATVVLGVATMATLLSIARDQSIGWSTWASNGLVLLVCFFIGRTVATRRVYLLALEERALVAEANRERAAVQAVLEERRRIARELHDVVAHHISVMGVLATGARRALSRDLATADEALATIESTGRATLREMRRLLDVLRGDDETPDTVLTPQPGVAGLGTLVTQVREAGLPVTLTLRGTPPPLDPGVDLTVFRVVQEALTNALKHAGPANAEVHLGFHADRLELRVSDDGRGPAAGSPGTGHGLVGMRERVSLYGGTVRTGPRRGGGYTVAARIPLEPATEATAR